MEDIVRSKTELALAAIIEEARKISEEIHKKYKANEPLNEEDVKILVEWNDKINNAFLDDVIYVDRAYCEGMMSTMVTINFKYVKDRSLKPTDEDRFRAIKGYSFGPFQPEKYFALPVEERYLWILKEPYCKNLNEYETEERHRSMHCQHKSYGTWEKIPKKKEEGITLYNMVDLTKTYIEEFTDTVNKPKYDLKDDAKMNDLMSHICVLEANHFPGLSGVSTKTNDDLIGHWVNRNEYFKDIIRFYRPAIVFGGNTLQHFTGTSDPQALKKLINQGVNILEKLGYNLDFKTPLIKSPLLRIDPGNDYIFPSKGENKCIFVDAYHPMYYVEGEEEKYDRFKRDAKWIKNPK